MPLTDTAIRSAKPGKKPKRLFDERGLYLEVSPAGGKWWRLKYRFGGKEKRLSLGVYPDTGLALARGRREEMRNLVASGIDPSQNRRAAKSAQRDREANSFEVVTREWLGRYSTSWAATHGDRMVRLFERDIFPWIGGRPISGVTAPDLLLVVRRIEARGALETAHRALGNCGQVFRYAVATGRCDRDPSGGLRGALPPVQGKHLAPTTEPMKLAEILRAMDGYEGTLTVRCALRLAPLVFVRPGELRRATWKDVDLEAAEWRYVVTKTKTPHIVPLSRQAVSGISYFLLLLLATGFAIRNGIRQTFGSRPFWVCLAIAYGLWALNQGLKLYYEFGRHMDAPDNIADPVLFLHIVPLMAAVATLPHRNIFDRKPYRAILNTLLLLFFWGFLYGYIVFPYQYLFSSSATLSSYGGRFDILYLLENLALVLAVGILTLRVQAPWKSIYLHLFGASILYTLSSAVANLAIDSGGYVNGKLYGLGLTASVCWFVWVPLRAQQELKPEARATRFDSGEGSRGSIWAMLVVVMISIPIVWELFQRDESTGLRTLRVLVAIAAIVCLASAAYIKEYLARRELDFHVGLANDRLRLAMEASASVGWDFDVKSGRDVWFGDLQKIFGIASDAYVTTREDFIRYVHPDDRTRVSEAIANARQNRKLYAADFRIVKPDGTVRWLAARGKFYYARNGNPERMLGVSLDITERKLAEEKLQEYEKAVEGSDEMMAVVDREYRYLIANQKFLSQRNMTKEQVVGRLVPEVLNKGVFETVVKEKLDECFRGSVVTYEMRYTYPELGERDLLISNFPIEGPGGVDRVACILQDITERKRAEEALSCMNRRVIDAEERERNRIARDLHENVGQRLTLLAIAIEQLKNDFPHQAVQLLDRLDAVWRKTLEILTDVKASAHELYSPRFEYLSIAAVMKIFCEEFGERKRVEIEFRSHDFPSLVLPDVSICLFRVLQEALHNGVMHSGVQKFSVQLWGESDEIHLRVSDSGVGFDLRAERRGRELGLIRIEQRVKLVEGTFSIDSQPEKGTTVHVSVPLRSGLDSMRAAG